MQLSDKAVRVFKPKEKPYKVADGDGLYILVTGQGTPIHRPGLLRRGSPFGYEGGWPNGRGRRGTRRHTVCNGPFRATPAR